MHGEQIAQLRRLPVLPRPAGAGLDEDQIHQRREGILVARVTEPHGRLAERIGPKRQGGEIEFHIGDPKEH